MMSFQFIFFYSLTVFIASIIPGPSMLLALSHGMQYGVRKTIASALGNVTVTLIQALISIAGLGTILIASETVFQLIKLAGAAYLIHLGISLFRSENTLVKAELGKSSNPVSPAKMYRQAALVTAGNPKAIVFFTAIFPQLISPDKGYIAQSSILLIICALIAFGCFMIYAFCGKKIIPLFTGVHFGKTVNRIIGSTFIGTGIGIAVSNT